MRPLARSLVVFALCIFTLQAEPVTPAKPKRLHWLRRIGSAEVALAERLSSIRLRRPVLPRPAETPILPTVPKSTGGK